MLEIIYHDKISLSEAESFKKKIDSKACRITLKIICHDNLKISLYGLDIEYYHKDQILKCGNSEAPVTSKEGILTLDVIYDTIYAEIFAEDGSVFMGIKYIQDSSLDTFVISSWDGIIESLQISEIGKFY